MRPLADNTPRGTTGAASPFYLRSNVLGEYRVERVISTGATGGVVIARHARRAGLVVIKLLHPHLCDDVISVARLSREAHVLGRVASDHIVRLLDTGWTELVGPYIVLEHLPGMDLAKTLEAKGALPTALALDYLLQACAGLSVAHAAGITHRDIKPENLFCVEGRSSPWLALLDFGIAQHGPESFPYRDVAASDPDTQLMGTPSYMSPERILDRPTADHRADIWSLGVVLHELLTGRPLFGRADVAETCARVVRHRFELESDLAVLPKALRIVIARCLARRPEHRFQSVGELAHALHGAAILPASSWGLMTGKFRREPLARPEALPSVAGAAPADVAAPKARVASRWKAGAVLAVMVTCLALLTVCKALDLEPGLEVLFWRAWALIDVSPLWFGPW